MLLTEKNKLNTNLKITLKKSVAKVFVKSLCQFILAGSFCSKINKMNLSHIHIKIKTQEHQQEHRPTCTEINTTLSSVVYSGIGTFPENDVGVKRKSDEQS